MTRRRDADRGASASVARSPCVLARAARRDGRSSAPWLPFERRQDLSNIRAGSELGPSVRHGLPRHRHGRPSASTAPGLAARRLGSLAPRRCSWGPRSASSPATGGVGRTVASSSCSTCSPPFRHSSPRRLASLVEAERRTNLMFVLGVLTAPVFARVTRAVDAAAGRARLRPGVEDDRCPSSPRDGARAPAEHRRAAPRPTRCSPSAS